MWRTPKFKWFRGRFPAQPCWGKYVCCSGQRASASNFLVYISADSIAEVAKRIFPAKWVAIQSKLDNAIWADLGRVAGRKQDLRWPLLWTLLNAWVHFLVVLGVGELHHSSKPLQYRPYIELTTPTAESALNGNLLTPLQGNCTIASRQ